jgi:hypothetical protein
MAELPDVTRFPQEKSKDETMRLIDSIRAAWREQGQFQRRYGSPTLDEAGLVLGASTVLAKRMNGVLDLDSDNAQARILALLSAAYGSVIAVRVLGHIERAAKAERDGNRVLAAIHLAHAGLPSIVDDENACHRLFFFERLIEEGTAPSTIARAQWPGSELIERGNPYHDECGRFTTPEGAAGGTVPVAYKPGKQKPAAKPAKPKAPTEPKKPPNYTAWKTRPNADFRQKLAEKESTANQPNNGYGVEVENGALGRYQMLKGALVDAGWKNKDDTWTEKAEEAGVKNDSDFLKNPEAQEQALTDALEAYHGQLKRDGALDYVGKTITDSAGNQLTVSEAGLTAAAHKQGSHAVRIYLDSQTRQPKDSDPARNIPERLRYAADLPYDSDANARQANTGKTGPHAPKKQ